VKGHTKWWGVAVIAACGTPPAARPTSVHAPLSSAADARMITSAASIAGSTPESARPHDDYQATANQDSRDTGGS
jgi:hypothetical protein